MKEFYTNIYQLGNSICVRGIDDEGKAFRNKIPFEPYVFVDADKHTGYVDINGNHVKKVNFESISEAKDYLKKYSDVFGMRIMGLTNWSYLYIFENYMDIEPDFEKVRVVYLDIEVQSDDGFPKPEEASKPITAIALTDKKHKICLGIGDYKPPKDQKNIYYIKCDNEKALLYKFIEIWDKISADIITGWNIKQFDIPYLVNRIRQVIGEEYVKRLSPWRMVRESKIKGMNGEEIQSYQIAGISNLDYLVLYKKFQLDPRESYKLDSICEVELGEKKLDYSEYSNLHTLYRENHQKFIEYNLRDNDLVMLLEEKLGFIAQAITIAYDAKVNFEDAVTSVLLWDVISHNHLMSKGIVVKQKQVESYDESIVGAYVKDPVVGMHDWVVSFDLNSLYPNLIIEFSIGPDTRVTRGKLRSMNDCPARAFFLEKLDSNDIVIGVNPDNYLGGSSEEHKMVEEHLRTLNITMTANGALYERRKSFFAELMEKMYNDRVMYKNKMMDAKKKYESAPSKELSLMITRYDNLQKAKKVQLNSAYGSFANKYFRWFSVENAEAITKSGQLAIRWVERDINIYLNKTLKTDNIDYVLAIDTDSVYVNFSSLINKFLPDEKDGDKVTTFLDKICEGKLKQVISDSYDNLALVTNATEQKMIMKRENIADKAIWLAKKKYIMNVWDSEGIRYKEPKLKMMGIEAIRSSTPTVCRKYITEAIKLIIKGDEEVVRDYIINKKKEYATLDFDQIAFPRSVNFMMGSNKQSWQDSVTMYKKGTPIQVRAALVYNNYIKEHDLTNKYETIKSGDKIKFCYMKLPNPLKENVIGAPRELPAGSNLHQYIDYNLQYEKAFLAPMRTILDSVKWSITTAEKTATLEAFL